ncbi:heparinase II/III family protein [Georgenia sp. TF02-10]|uniref:heparinase II/III domain-containing protein n=1 Tax=Georgenia sp. TF02-10 TaxID=2917725 RepID=UPI001FA7B3E3|nr:heparinase II/III family protein [Georgenia sp. TF02-10]UNX53735.1 heparinase II/III family protein [Georgenia sp. TF02-10]
MHRRTAEAGARRPAARGPLLSAWGPRASAAALRTSLLPPGAALPVPAATDRACWDVAATGTGRAGPRRSVTGPATTRPAARADAPTARADPPTARAVLARADHDVGRPWPQPTASRYARYHRDGDRDGYEQLVFARQHRLSRAVVAAAVDPSPARLDEVADGVWALCEQSSWCWPAHDDTRAVHGAVLPTVTDPYLDLGAGEVVGQLAWTDHLLGAFLDERYPGLRDRVRHEARVRVLDPFVRRRDWHWLGLDGDVHNWNPWIHGNLLLAALALEPDRAARADVVALVIEGLDRYVASLPADGAVDEGYAYWWNGACRTLEAAELLQHATGGALDATGVPALRATVAFPHRMHLGAGAAGDWYLNLGDGPARPGRAQPWDVLHRWARDVGDDDARRHAASYRTPGAPVGREDAGLGRLVRAMTDRAWAAATPAPAPLVRDVWLPSTQVLLARRARGDASVTLAVKGGHNGEHHNHNDVGSVVVAVDGVPVLVDPGRPTYTARTFGPDRYDLWPMQSDWHNVPRLPGTGQAAGARFAARDVTATVDDGAAGLRLDLAGAYPGYEDGRWVRTATLDRATGAVEVRDEWTLPARPGPGADDGRTVPDHGEVAPDHGGAAPDHGGAAPDHGGAALDDGGPAPDAGQPVLDDGVAVRWVLAGTVIPADAGPGTPPRLEVRPLDGARATILTWEDDRVVPTLETRALEDPMLSAVWGPTLTRLTLRPTTDAGRAGSLVLRVEVRR